MSRTRWRFPLDDGPAFVLAAASCRLPCKKLLRSEEASPRSRPSTATATALPPPRPSASRRHCPLRGPRPSALPPPLAAKCRKSVSQSVAKPQGGERGSAHRILGRGKVAEASPSAAATGFRRGSEEERGFRRGRRTRLLTHDFWDICWAKREGYMGLVLFGPRCIALALTSIADSFTSLLRVIYAGPCLYLPQRESNVFSVGTDYIAAVTPLYLPAALSPPQLPVTSQASLLHSLSHCHTQRVQVALRHPSLRRGQSPLSSLTAADSNAGQIHPLSYPPD